MHDPMVVAFDVVTPIPKRDRWKDTRLAKPTGLVRRRRTNTANLGEPVYPWWRPAGWEGGVCGRAFGLYQVATVWHVEPNDADAFTVCQHNTRWKWHVHHWRVQVHLLGKFHRFMRRLRHRQPSRAQPDRHAVATALLAAQCPAGVCVRDVDQLDRALRGRLYLQADNLIANPFGLLDALGLRVVPDDYEVQAEG